MTENIGRAYKIKQYFYDAERGERNTEVRSYDDLATHHPKSNFNAQMVDGILRNVERPQRRSHAFIDGEYQETETPRTDEYHSLKPDQVLLIKDFILEDVPAAGVRTRVVDVPAPVAGYVSRRDDRNGVVEIADNPGGNVVARIRHLGPIDVEEGQTLVYGQSLGTQNAIGLPKGAGKHVHIEMDTGHAQDFENYVNDLVSGRLPVQAEHRVDVQPLSVTGDDTFRLGESNRRILELQRVMSEEGYRAAGGEELDQDGVYRPGMQGALLDFQRAHGLPQTGNIDPATLQMAPPMQRRVIDREDVFTPGRPMHAQPPAEPTAPGHPGHPDHRQNLTYPLPPPVNRQASGPRRSPADPAHPDHAMLQQISEEIHKVDDGIGKPHDERSEEHTSELQSLMRNSYAVFCLNKKKETTEHHYNIHINKKINTKQRNYIINRLS